MTIQWFPGHMTKARRQVVEKLKLVDIIFELVDSRIPYSSSNPMLNEIIKSKPKLVLLNKSDIADSKITHMWEKFYSDNNIPSVRINSVKGTGVDKITSKAKEVLKEKFEKERKKGLKPRPVRAMILGIPNVGKSTLINKLAKRKATQTGDRPGVTKAQQWIKVGKELELLDTPGILWPKFDDQKVGYKLAVTGAIKDTILPIDDVVLYAIEYLKNNYSKEFKERYTLSSLLDNFQILDDIGKVRGCLRSGGVVDYDRVYEKFLHDLRGNRIGNISFETPDVISQSERNL